MRKTSNIKENWITIAKGIAILTVVLGHVEMFGFTKVPLAFQIPLFGILSGLTFKDFSSLKHFIKKKTVLYITPYLFASLISIIIWFLIYTHNDFLNTTPFIFSTIFLPVLLGLNPIYNAPLWFLPAFLISQILWAIYFKYFVKVKENVLAIIFLIILNFILGFFIHIAFKNYYNSILIPYSIDLAFILSGFIGIGVIIKNKININSNSMLPFILLISVFFVGIHFNGSVNFFGREFNFIPLFIINAITGSFIILYISKYIEIYSKNIFIYFKKILLYLGNTSLFIMLYHWPSLLLLNVLMFNNEIFLLLRADQTLVTMVLPYERNLQSIVTKLTYFSLYTIWALLGASVLGTAMHVITKKLAAVK